MHAIRPFVAACFLCFFSAIAFDVSASLIDGQPVFDAAKTAGVYIWRANGTYVIRVTSGGKVQDVAGGFSSTQPFNWVSNTATEATDMVKKTYSAMTEFDLKTSPTDYVDGIDFSVPAGAGICFWNSGTLGNTVRLGATATPVTTPVDLLNNGACAGQPPRSMVDGEPVYAAGKNAGVYIWREVNGNFTVRFTSGGGTQSVTGGFSATQPFNWISATGLETGDVLTKTGPSMAGFTLKTSGSDFVDGIDFAVPAGAGVCFWGWGTLGTTVYLGAGATPIATPVDLLNNGGCAGGGNAALKYNPGHYIAMNDWEGQPAMIEAASKPGVKGVLVRYLWKDLEPSYGVYDFSKVESDLALMASMGSRLIAMVADKSFKPDEMPTPPYLWASYTVPHNNPQGGYVAKRWLPYVTQRMSALTEAMGKRLDDNPYFEGVTFEESCMSFTDAMQKSYNYSPEQYRDQTIQVLKDTRAHFPKSQVLWSMNFIEGNQSYIGQVADAVAPYKVAMGGPDILPDNQSLVTLTYPYYSQYKDRMTLFGSVQYVEYGQLHSNQALGKYWTMPQLFAYARDQLFTKYIIWTQKRTPNPPDSYIWTDALPVIAKNPKFNP